jgi:hypothetical protein
MDEKPEIDEGQARLAEMSPALVGGAWQDLSVRGEAEIQRLHDLERARDGDDLAEFDRRFGAGSGGIHEILDRVHVAHETWERYILDHPSTLLDPNLYLLATQVSLLMGLLYQRTGERL